MRERQVLLVLYLEWRSPSPGGKQNVIQFVEIATQGNAVDFGDRTIAKRYIWWILRIKPVEYLLVVEHQFHNQEMMDFFVQ